MHPSLLHLGPITLPTFGVLTAIGVMLSLWLSLTSAPLAGLAVPSGPEKLWNAGIFTVAAAFVLSRLLLVVTYLHSFLSYPILLLAVPSLTPLGLMLTVLVTLVYLYRRDLPLLPTLDAWAPCATLLWFFLALGHFFEASDPGMPSSLPWAVALPTDSTRTHPVGLYAAILAAIFTAVLFLQLRRDHRRGRVAALAFALVGLAQFLLTFLREPGSVAGLLDPIQWLALGFLALAAILWVLPVPLMHLPDRQPNQPKEPRSHAL